MTLTPTVLREYDRGAPDTDELARATFGLGCFWGPDAEFGALDGVVRTRVGYAGGTKADPTYHALGDHTEVLQVDFDPETLAYREVVAEVFRSHYPNRQTGKRQYHNVVLTANETQRETALAVVAEQGYNPDSIETRIESLSQFSPAEQYHQKYNLRSHSGLMDTFEEAGYGDVAVRESPAAAKLNAHVAGEDVSLPFLDARTR